MESNNRPEIIIASGNFLEHLGLKTIINTMGIKYDLLEVYTYNDLKNALTDQVIENRFVIVTENFTNDKHDIEAIANICKQCNLMYVCDQIPETNSIKYFILSSCNGREAYNKFNAFFSSNEDNKRDSSTADKSILSDREIEVLKEVASGLSNKEIADKLFISINTVISHRKKITEKLDIKSISGLTVYALMNDLINPDEITI